MELQGMLIRGFAVVLICVGCGLAWPGQFGQHVIGLVLIIAGLELLVFLMRSTHRDKLRRDLPEKRN